ncbi:MAG: AMP-binding protein, partial [Pseudomonadota bacterium]
AGQESDIGVFYQQIPYIIDLQTLADDKSAKDFFAHQRDYRRAIRDYQQISLSAQNRFMPAGRIAFQFNYFNFLRDVEVCGYRSFPYTFSSHVDNTVQIFVKDYGDDGAVELWFDGSVFVPLDFIDRMVALVEQFAATGDLKFGELEYCLPLERDAEAVWNDTASQVQAPATLVHWFEEAVSRFGSNVAALYRDTALTYDELNRQANRLARLLRANNLQRGERVGICHGRSTDLLVAVWAVLKAGGTYIPIEASYPQERIQYILRDSGARLLLTEKCIAKRLPDYAGTALLLDAMADELAQFDAANLDDKPSGDDGIYIIYTSGSTGNPKGAALHHAGEVNLQQWYTQACQFGPADRTILVSAFGFDLTQKNLFGPLLCGGAVVIPAMDEYDAEVVAADIARTQATHINCAPSAFYALVEHLDEARARQLQSLRWVYLGGEPIRMNALYNWLQHPTCKAQIVNSYGPTECTDVVSWHVIDDISPTAAGVPIGRPICNTALHILNDALRPVPHGVVGEICITGAGVGLGYVNRDDLTA